MVISEMEKSASGGWDWGWGWGQSRHWAGNPQTRSLRGRIRKSKKV